MTPKNPKQNQNENNEELHPLEIKYGVEPKIENTEDLWAWH